MRRRTGSRWRALLLGSWIGWALAGCGAPPPGPAPWALEPHLVEVHERVSRDPDGAPAYDRIRHHYVSGRLALAQGDAESARFSFRLAVDCFRWLTGLSPLVEEDPDRLHLRSAALLRQLEGGAIQLSR